MDNDAARCAFAWQGSYKNGLQSCESVGVGGFYARGSFLQIVKVGTVSEINLILLIIVATRQMPARRCLCRIDAGGFFAKKIY